MENASLRESLSVIQRELVGLLNEQQSRRQKKVSKEGEGEGDGGAEQFGVLSSGHFQMPYAIVREGECVAIAVASLPVSLTAGIEKTFQEHLQRIREQLQQASSLEQRGGWVWHSIGSSTDSVCVCVFLC